MIEVEIIGQRSQDASEIGSIYLSRTLHMLYKAFNPTIPPHPAVIEQKLSSQPKQPPEWAQLPKSKGQGLKRDQGTSRQDQASSDKFPAFPPLWCAISHASPARRLPPSRHSRYPGPARPHSSHGITFCRSPGPADDNLSFELASDMDMSILSNAAIRDPVHPC